MKISVFSRTPRSKALPELYSQGLLSTVSTNSPIFKKQCISQKIFLFESYPTLELSTQRMYFMTEQVIFITHSLSAIPMKKENTYLMLQKWRLLICNLWRLEHITYHTLISSFIKAIKKKKTSKYSQIMIFVNHLPQRRKFPNLPYIPSSAWRLLWAKESPPKGLP